MSGPPEGLSSMPEKRLGEQGQIVGEDVCRECGTNVGAGYLCDECDTLEVAE